MKLSEGGFDQPNPPQRHEYDIEINANAAVVPPSPQRNPCQYSVFEHVNTLAHLACFGIIGVLARYGLETLFADVFQVTHEGTDLYRDLPANMVGSFFMGWVGIVFKRNIASVSEPLAISLSTGLMGSITTFAAWNQKMVSLMTTGNVAAALVGLLIGMALAMMALIVGVDTAKAVKAKFLQHNCLLPAWFHRWLGSSAIFFAASVCLWGAALALFIKGGSSQKLRILWLACIVAPPGVWARWHLAYLNEEVLGTRLEWLPRGTMLANLLAASLEAFLAFIQDEVAHHNVPLLVGGLQFGFLGCMSTVSALVAEVYTMHGGARKPQAYTYTFATLILGLVSGTLLYSMPTWIKSYVKW